MIALHGWFYEKVREDRKNSGTQLLKKIQDKKKLQQGIARGIALERWAMAPFPAGFARYSLDTPPHNETNWKLATGDAF